MTQTKEIIELKRRLKNTADQLAKGSCSKQEDIDKMAYPVVYINEEADDDIFHSKEDLKVFVGIRTNDKNVKVVTPIPEEPVAIFYADGSEEWKLTDEDGFAEMKNPRAVGKTAFDVPNILLYSDGKSFYVVE